MHNLLVLFRYLTGKPFKQDSYLHPLYIIMHVPQFSYIGTRFVLTCRNVLCADSEVDMSRQQLTVSLADKEATRDSDWCGKTLVVFRQRESTLTLSGYDGQLIQCPIHTVGEKSEGNKFS